MPDANSVAASHDIVQMLFYFVCALGMAIALSSAAIFRFVLLPLKDGAIDFFKHQVVFMDTAVMALREMKAGDELRHAMHEQNLKKLSDIHRVAEEIKVKVKCPENHPKGAAGHV